MSELTQCNFCSLQERRRLAKKEGMAISLRPGWNGGTDILVHPKSVVIPPGQLSDNSPLRKKYISSWMMEISERCSC